MQNNQYFQNTNNVTSKKFKMHIQFQSAYTMKSLLFLNRSNSAPQDPFPAATCIAVRMEKSNRYGI